MTDKQIIIDGIDVSGCEHFCREVCCEVGFGKDASCKLFEDCLYKKYKRKEQECEELKKRISNYKCPMDKNADYCGHLEDYGELLGQLYQLKAENERLKQGIKHYQRGMFSIINTATECRNNKKWNYKE